MQDAVAHEQAALLNRLQFAEAQLARRFGALSDYPGPEVARELWRRVRKRFRRLRY